MERQHGSPSHIQLLGKPEQSKAVNMNYEEWKQYVVDYAKERADDFLLSQFCTDGAFEDATVSREALSTNPVIMVMTVGKHIQLAAYTLECQEDSFTQEGRTALSSLAPGEPWPKWGRLGISRRIYDQPPGDVDSSESAVRQSAAREWEALADYTIEPGEFEKHVWFFPRGLLDGEWEFMYTFSRHQ